jgi:hypothetical protein
VFFSRFISTAERGHSPSLVLYSSNLFILLLLDE